MDETSEELGGRFVNGEVDLPVFLSTYLEERIQYHLMSSKLNVALR